MNAFEETDDGCMYNCRYCQKDKIYDCAKELAELEGDMNMVDSIYFDLLTTSIICSKCFGEEFSNYYSDDGA
jgi:hypothetical protein